LNSNNKQVTSYLSVYFVYSVNIKNSVNNITMSSPPEDLPNNLLMFQATLSKIFEDISQCVE